MNAMIVYASDVDLGNMIKRELSRTYERTNGRTREWIRGVTRTAPRGETPSLVFATACSARATRRRGRGRRPRSVPIVRDDPPRRIPARRTSCSTAASPAPSSPPLARRFRRRRRRRRRRRPSVGERTHSPHSVGARRFHSACRHLLSALTFLAASVTSPSGDTSAATTRLSRSHIGRAVVSRSERVFADAHRNAASSSLAGRVFGGERPTRPRVAPRRIAARAHGVASLLSRAHRSSEEASSSSS